MASVRYRSRSMLTRGAQTHEMIRSITLAPLETRTIPDLLTRSVQFGLERPWVIESSSGKSLYYGEFLERTACAANTLSRRFPRGAHIAVMLSNHIEFFIVRFGISCAGLVEVSLNGDQRGAVLKGMLETAKPSGFIVDARHREPRTADDRPHQPAPGPRPVVIRWPARRTSSYG